MRQHAYFQINHIFLGVLFNEATRYFHFMFDLVPFNNYI